MSKKSVVAAILAFSLLGLALGLFIANTKQTPAQGDFRLFKPPEPPPAPQTTNSPLKYLYSDTTTHAALIFLKNVSDKDIHVSGGRFESNKMGFYTIRRNPKHVGNEIVMRNHENKSNNHTWWSQSGFTLTPGEISKVRVRILNPNFPGVYATGKLTISYKDDEDRTGTVVVDGLSIDIESW